jgi:hypothetical protein
MFDALGCVIGNPPLLAAVLASAFILVGWIFNLAA